jgi:hypothetical protein
MMIRANDVGSSILDCRQYGFDEVGQINVVVIQKCHPRRSGGLDPASSGCLLSKGRYPNDPNNSSGIGFPKCSVVVTAVGNDDDLANWR